MSVWVKEQKASGGVFWTEREREASHERSHKADQTGGVAQESSHDVKTEQINFLLGSNM